MTAPESAPESRPNTRAASQVTKNLYWVLLAAIVAVAARLRFLHIGEKSFWMDEGVSFNISHLSWLQFLKITWRHELNMAPYHVLLRIWMWFGTSEAFLRSLSAFFSIGTVVVVYLLGRRLFGIRAGLFASLLAALHVFLVRYAQEARSYSLVTLLAALSCLFFVRNVQETEHKSWTGYSVATVLAIYTHFFALLVVLAQWLSLQLLRKSNAGALLRRTWKIIGISLLPMLAFIAGRGAGPIAWIPRPDAASLYHFLILLTGNGGGVLLAAYAILLVVICGILVVRRSQLTSSLELWGSAFALSWLLVPIVVALIFSLARPVFLPRYLLFCVLPLVLLAAAAIVRLPSAGLQAAAMLLLAWFSIRGVQSYYQADIDVSREDWRGTTHYVLSERQAGDGVVFHAALGRMPYEYYVLRAGPGVAPPVVAFPASGPRITYNDFVANAKRAPIDGIAKDYSRVWLVLAHNQIPGKGLDDVTKKLESALMGTFPCVVRKRFPEIQVLLYFHGDCLSGDNRTGDENTHLPPQS